MSIFRTKDICFANKLKILDFMFDFVFFCMNNMNQTKLSCVYVLLIFILKNFSFFKNTFKLYIYDQLRCTFETFVIYFSKKKKIQLHSFFLRNFSDHKSLVLHWILLKMVCFEQFGECKHFVLVNASKNDTFKWKRTSWFQVISFCIRKTELFPFPHERPGKRCT